MSNKYKNKRSLISVMNPFDAKKVTEDCVAWIKNLFDTNWNNSTNCCVALSGGKDSSIVAALAVKALGPDRVKGLMLPQHEQHDISYSIQCAEFLGIEYKIVNIGSAVDAVIKEMKRSGITPTTQAVTNVPPRIRMTALYFYAQCVNGIPSCNCNLSEDWVGYATYGGDGFGSFAPLSHLTVTEVKQIGYELDLPRELIEKTPIDGLCGKTDEDNLGFTYAVLDRYIRTGICEDAAIKAKIDLLHEKNKFKLELMPSFPYPA